MSFDVSRAREFTPEEAAQSPWDGLVVYLGSCGNPDFGQDPNHPLYGAEKNRLALVKSLEDASRLCREFITKNELGGGNWTGGHVFNAVSGEALALVSYNGRIWEYQLMSADELAKCIRDKSGSGETEMIKNVSRLAKHQAPAILKFLNQRIDAAIAAAAAPAPQPARPRR